MHSRIVARIVIFLVLITFLFLNHHEMLAKMVKYGDYAYNNVSELFSDEGKPPLPLRQQFAQAIAESLEKIIGFKTKTANDIWNTYTDTPACCHLYLHDYLPSSVGYCYSQDENVVKFYIKDNLSEANVLSIEALGATLLEILKNFEKLYDTVVITYDDDNAAKMSIRFVNSHVQSLALWQNIGITDDEISERFKNPKEKKVLANILWRDANRTIKNTSILFKGSLNPNAFDQTEYEGKDIFD